MSRNSLWVVLLAFACQGQSLYVGYDGTSGTGGTDDDGSARGGRSTPAGGTGGTAPPTPALPDRDGCPIDPEFEAFVGAWEGEVLDFSFQVLMPVRLEINGVSASSGVCGTIRYGDAEPPPPIEDPDEGYPPPGWTATHREFLSGYTYTIVEGGARESTLQVAASGYEIWSEWCALQAPVFDPDGVAYPNCVESWESRGQTGNDCTLFGPTGTVTYTYGKCYLCGMGPTDAEVCACNENGCGARYETWALTATFVLGQDPVGTPTLTDATKSPERLATLVRVE